MRAYGFLRAGGPENEAFLDVEEPVPGPDELLVRVRAAGVNPGDWRVRSGSYGLDGPAVLGREVAGTVVALGPGVAEATGFAVGDEVFGGCPGMVGGFAELARVTASFSALRPPAVRPEDACVLPVAAGTAYDALTAFGLAPGQVLLVNGAGGGVGAPLVQLAAARGITVVATASPGKHERLRAWGARPVAYGDGVLDRVRAEAPDGVDAVLDLVGGDSLREVATLVAPGALRSVADKPLVAELGGADVPRERTTEVLAALAGLVADGTLDPGVADVRPFAEAADAMRLVESGHAAGKVVLAVWTG